MPAELGPILLIGALGLAMLVASIAAACGR